MNARMCAKLPGVCNLVFFGISRQSEREGGKVHSKGQKQEVPCPRLLLRLCLKDKRMISVTLLSSG